MARDWHKYRHSYGLFGQKVRELRRMLGWSIRQLARTASLNPGTVKRVETGTDPLRPDKRRRFVEMLADVSDAHGIALLSRREWFRLAGLEFASFVLAGDERVRVAESGDRPGQPSALDYVAARSASITAGRRRETPLAEVGSYAEQARAAHQGGDWSRAELLWLLEAGQATDVQDWETWGHATVAAGEMALNLSKFGTALGRFGAVVKRPEAEVGVETQAEALLRLGWVYYEQELYARSLRALTDGQAKLEKVLGLRDGDAALLGLQEMGFHFLGRALGEQGSWYGNDANVRRALDYLQRSFEIDTQQDAPWNMGFSLLRQVPLLEYAQKEKEARRLLGQAEELLSSPWNEGHLYLHRALLATRAAERRDFLEAAVLGYTRPVFSPRGLAEVLLEIATSTSDAKVAFTYALLSGVLHPYGSHLSEVGSSVSNVYYQLLESSREFSTFYGDTLERLRHFDGDPFALLSAVEYSYDPGSGTRRIEESLPRIRKAVWEALPPPARALI